MGVVSSQRGLRVLVSVVSLGVLSACGVQYSPPSASGLVAVRAFPGPGDVCQVIGENGLTSDYLDDASVLIGCPAHEVGAIRDHVDAGGVQVGAVGAWQLISVPVR